MSTLPVAHMRALPPVAAILIALACAKATFAQPALRAGDHRFTLRHGVRARSYIVHVPGGSGPFPVMIAYHGGGGEAQGFKD